MDKFFTVKYSTDDLLKRIQTPLKLFKNKKQVSKKFNVSDVFPTDPVPKEFLSPQRDVTTENIEGVTNTCSLCTSEPLSAGHAAHVIKTSV